MIVGRFANESFRQRSFRKRLRSVRKYLWSVRKRVEVSSQTLSTFICVEASSVLISDVNIWPYKLTLKPSLVVDFALSQRLRIAYFRFRSWLWFGYRNFSMKLL